MFLGIAEIAQRRMMGMPLCDFCSRQDPIVKFTQKRAFMLRDRDGNNHLFADAWAACADCAPLVERKQMNLLLDRVIALSPLYQGMSRAQKKAKRQFVKKLYRAMYAAGVEKSEPLESAASSAPTPGELTEEGGQESLERVASVSSEPATAGELISFLRQFPSRCQVWIANPSEPGGAMPLAPEVNIVIDPDPEPGAPAKFVLLHPIQG